jgi:hypothetical protein
MTLNEPAFGHDRTGVAFADVEFPDDARTFRRPFLSECRAGINGITRGPEQVRPVRCLRWTGEQQCGETEDEDEFRQVRRGHGLRGAGPDNFPPSEMTVVLSRLGFPLHGVARDYLNPLGGQPQMSGALHTTWAFMGLLGHRKNSFEMPPRIYSTGLSLGPLAGSRGQNAERVPTTGKA